MNILHDNITAMGCTVATGYQDHIDGQQQVSTVESYNLSHLNPNGFNLSYPSKCQHQFGPYKTTVNNVAYACNITMRPWTDRFALGACASFFVLYP